MADNYFKKPVTDLRVGTDHYFQFRWKYADGTYSDWSVSKYVLTAGTLQVEDPTLPTGLSVATASFGVTASWDGTYASSGFLGFKSVNIYASTSNLGSTTTTNLTANLVGSMTVDEIANKITIGSTLLKNVLGLTSTSVYTTPMYFYYISVNANNELYKVGGVATYTRINSSGISPTQANFIDLAAGTISIENLVAGNGNFTEFLRVGTAGGARVEIGGNSSVTTGAGVTPGLAIYNSANQAVLSAPLSGGLTITGIIQQGTSGNYLLMDQTDKASIKFYNTGFSIPGVISTEALYGGQNGYMQIKPPSYGTEDTPAFINMFNNPSSSSLFINAGSVNIDGGSQFTLSSSANGIQILNPISLAVWSVRNMYARVSSITPGASDGNIGDVWLSY